MIFHSIYSPKIWFWVPDNFTTNKKHHSTTIKLLTIKCASTMFYMHVTLRLLRSSHCNWKLQFHPQPWNVTMYFQSWVLTEKKNTKLHPLPMTPVIIIFLSPFCMLENSARSSYIVLERVKVGVASCLKLPFWMSVKDSYRKALFLGQARK